jgi:hypothetical protein
MMTLLGYIYMGIEVIKEGSHLILFQINSISRRPVSSRTPYSVRVALGIAGLFSNWICNPY